jgi:hypothetical protein
MHSEESAHSNRRVTRCRLSDALPFVIKEENVQGTGRGALFDHNTGSERFCRICPDD